MFNVIFFNIIISFIISVTWCANIEQIVVSPGEPFSFDCNKDDSVYFAQQINDWIEIKNQDSTYSHLNLNFIIVHRENVLRVKSNSADAANVGYYGCRRSSAKQSSMSRVYQVILADIDSFYWSYVCHGPVGSCIRFDDQTDETRSTFEVADQTKVDLYCCASVLGYENVNINMNQVGENQNDIIVKRTQDLDGSSVICANQHTVFQKTYSRNSDTLTCELIINDQVYSTYTSLITINDAMPSNPDIDSPDIYPRFPGDGSDTNDNRGSSNSEKGRKVMTGKRIAVIISILIASLLVTGLLLALIFCILKTKKSKRPEIAEKSPRRKEEDVTEEPLYVEPIPEYQNAIVFSRH